LFDKKRTKKARNEKAEEKDKRRRNKNKKARENKKMWTNENGKAKEKDKTGSNEKEKAGERNKTGSNKKKKAGKKNRKRVKRIDLPSAVRRLKLQNLYLYILIGGEDFAANLFISTFISNLINCYGRVFESALGIDGFFAEVIPAAKQCFKIRVNAYFDLFIYKILRIFLTKR
jgi:hypothetical protein